MIIHLIKIIMYYFNYINDPFLKTYLLKLEKVKKERDLEKGLMFRKKLEEDHGMLFSYNDDGIRNMWMKNTYIPLDVIFLDENYKVIGYVENTEPLSLDNISIDEESRYVVEVNAGTVKKYDIRKDEYLKFIITKTHQ